MYFSGVEEVSSWLTKPALLRLLCDIGMDVIEMGADRDTPYGMRLVLVAFRRKPLLRRLADFLRGRLPT